MISLKIGDGKTVGTTEYNLAKSSIKLGRINSNDVVLDDISVSRVHACIRKVKNQFVIIDQKSANGLYLDGQKLPPLEEIPLRVGQRVIIGKFNVELIEQNVSNSTEIDATIHHQSKSEQPQTNTPHRPPSQSLSIDIIEFKQDIHTKLLAQIDLRRLDINDIGEDELRDRCDKIVRQIIQRSKKTIPPTTNLEEFVKDILDEALALGPLEEFLADPSISEIMVNSRDKIYIEKNGSIELSPKVFSSDESVAGIIQRIVSPIGRRIDESSPMVDARLKDGSRVNAVIPPLALNGPCITIRKFATNPIASSDLVNWGALSKGMESFIKTCVEQKKNIVVSGGTGSGKTTLLNVFSSYIPQGERVVTLEDAAELQLAQEHIIRLESRPANIEGKGAIPIQELVKNALRMRPDRIIVGECRSGEALDMLQAMNTGHDGSMTTGHANTPKDMLTRLETMVMMAGQDLPSRAIREQIGSAIHIIVQQTRFACGTRKVTQISEVAGIEEGKIILQDIFYYRQDGLDQNGKVKGTFIATGWIPDFFLDLQQRGINIDMDIFQN